MSIGLNWSQLVSIDLRCRSSHQSRLTSVSYIYAQRSRSSLSIHETAIFETKISVRMIIQFLISNSTLQLEVIAVNFKFFHSQFYFEYISNFHEITIRVKSSDHGHASRVQLNCNLSTFKLMFTGILRSSARNQRASTQPCVSIFMTRILDFYYQTVSN